jgi:hypothetical protein
MPATQAKVSYPRITPKIQEELKADPKFQNLTSCIHRTWQVIGPDSEQCCAEQGEPPLKKSERLETTLDANYISFNCGKEGKEAEAYLQELEKKYGYKAVEKFLLTQVYI